MRSIGRGWIVLLFVSSTAVAETGDPSNNPTTPIVGSDPSGILGGTASTAGQFPAVVALEVGQGLCSGTLIDPEWVLTAGHCVDASEGITAANTTVHLNTISAFSGGITVGASEIIKQPMFNINSLGSHDIGLIHLKTPVTDIEPIAVNFDAAKAPVGVKVLMVGFGATAAGGGGTVGKLFSIDNRTAISCAQIGESDANLLCFSQTDSKGQCSGDSGGPSFVTIDGVRKVVAVTSFGDQNCTQFGADTRTDAEKAFLLQHIPNLEGCKTDADCGGKLCFHQTCINQPFSDGGIGGTCTGPEQCDTGQCASGDGGTLCTTTCTPGAADACPAGFDCLGSTGSSGVCWPADTGGGCCDASGQSGPTMLLGLGLIGFVLRRKRS